MSDLMEWGRGIKVQFAAPMPNCIFWGGLVLRPNTSLAHAGHSLRLVEKVLVGMAHIAQPRVPRPRQVHDQLQSEDILSFSYWAISLLLGKKINKK